jgi:hypothetical protein
VCIQQAPLLQLDLRGFPANQDFPSRSLFISESKPDYRALPRKIARAIAIYIKSAATYFSAAILLGCISNEFKPTNKQPRQ